MKSMKLVLAAMVIMVATMGSTLQAVTIQNNTNGNIWVMDIDAKEGAAVKMDIKIANGAKHTESGSRLGIKFPNNSVKIYFGCSDDTIIDVGKEMMNENLPAYFYESGKKIVSFKGKKSNTIFVAYGSDKKLELCYSIDGVRVEACDKVTFMQKASDFDKLQFGIESTHYMRTFLKLGAFCAITYGLYKYFEPSIPEITNKYITPLAQKFNWFAK